MKEVEGGWEEVRSLWRNRYEVGFCCKQKKKEKKMFCSKEKSNSGKEDQGVCGNTRQILTPQYKSDLQLIIQAH